MLFEKVLRKHVSIIHAYSLMSALQRKIVNVLLYEAGNNKNCINHQNSVAIECHIPFCSLAKAVNFNSNNTQYLKEAVDGLASIKIEWNLLKDKVPTNISFLNMRILHGAPTFYHDGTFNFSFHKAMLELTNNPPIYGTVDLGVQSQFESKYGHSLYENSTRFVNLHRNKILQLDIFKKLVGVSNDKYPTMREFTRNVILPSVEEVNDRAGFTVKLAGIKTGRKTTGFELSVNLKKKIIQTEENFSEFSDVKLREEIKGNFGLLSETVLDNILKQFSEKYIIEKIAYVKKYSKKEQTGFYPIPYFISALRDDYKSNEKKHQVEETKSAMFTCIEEGSWQEKEEMLQGECNHWEKVLEYMKKTSNADALSNVQKFFAQSEEKLRQHYLSRTSLKTRKLE